MIAGVTVESGDVVVADATGVTFVPRTRATEVLGLAIAVQQREHAIAADLRAGVPLPHATHDAPIGRRPPGATMGTLTDRFTALPTAAVSDALDTLELPGAMHGISPLTDSARAVGPAFTIRYEPIRDEPGTAGDCATTLQLHGLRDQQLPTPLALEDDE